MQGFLKYRQRGTDNFFGERFFRDLIVHKNHEYRKIY